MWFYYALSSSLLSAFSTVTNKKILTNLSASVLTWSRLFIATPIIFIFAIQGGVPLVNLTFFIGIFGSDILYTLNTILEFRAIQIADLSEIVPLMSLGPLITLIIATLPPLSERPGIMAVFGVVVTIVGVYVLKISKAKEGIFKPITEIFSNKASVLVLISLFIGGIVPFFDKLAINNTFPENSTFTLLMENIFTIIFLFPIIFARNKNLKNVFMTNLKWLLLIGILNAASNILVFSAIATTDVALGMTVKKAEILFVLVLSYLFFKDKPKPETIFGSLIMIGGIILIKLGA